MPLSAREVCETRVLPRAMGVRAAGETSKGRGRHVIRIKEELRLDSAVAGKGSCDRGRSQMVQASASQSKCPSSSETFAERAGQHSLWWSCILHQ
eukprot:6013353-Alexandrium_andersonii.AAC.1